MKKREEEKEVWEAPSLEWIHRVRRERQLERDGQLLRPLPPAESERLAKKYGLKLARHTKVG
jgi:hypothetical protein